MYNDEIIGYSSDEGKTIELNDSYASKKFRETLNQNQIIGVSSRAITPPPPPKDRSIKEPSWLETLTFGLYKTKKYIKRDDEQIR